MVRQISLRITSDPNVCHGKPVIAGTRVLVEMIVAQAANGESWDSIVENYPVTRDDIRAALRWAAKLVEKQSVRVKRAAQKTQA